MSDYDIKTLNTLIETTLDSADGYREAAEDSSRFTALFQSRATERSAAAARLQREVVTLGGTPEEDGTVLAKAHRLFVNLRNSISSGDTAVVDEVERGEDHIKAKFEAALADNELGVSTRAAIQDVYRSVKSGHDQMRDLKHSLHGAA
ncbi:PA2169 family four-helix-bundle protein [Sphingomonas sanxanigenens]|uniref:DUF2383 domain-containing protein n=1 Tax=Sphingomonas sanxanigenens DSM 19645 = NX02 TaxID=1123269 RepID=W0ADH8_9SPHN|nr:PA2169 family four-helix-bundle protein [Sphingomonas sanxanigenens]AHE55954.1 hypothetical protein NX02_21615 [Sphingomonas sanxanigenens DSM 19645 = NX02]